MWFCCCCFVLYSEKKDRTFHCFLLKACFKVCYYCFVPHAEGFCCQYTNAIKLSPRVRNSHLHVIDGRGIRKVEE